MFCSSRLQRLPLCLHPKIQLAEGGNAFSRTLTWEGCRVVCDSRGFKDEPLGWKEIMFKQEDQSEKGVFARHVASASLRFWILT